MFGSFTGCLDKQLAALEPEMVTPPPLEHVARCVPFGGEKDGYVLAGAVECGAGYLLTLARCHLLTSSVLPAGFAMKVMTPGDFLMLAVTFSFEVRGARRSDV